MWVAEHKDDVEVDVLRFLPQFGTDPFEVMTGPQLVRIAPRLAAYEGVVSGVIRRSIPTPTDDALGEQQSEVSTQVEHDPSRIRMPAGAKVVSLATMQLQNGDLIDRKVVGNDGD